MFTRVTNSRYEIADPRRLVEYHDPEEFDRIAFAMRALDRLRPKRVTVAVYPAVSALHVERGQDMRREGSSFAIVGIPPHASREHIAYALAEIAGVSSVPFAVRAILEAERRGA